MPPSIVIASPDAEAYRAVLAAELDEGCSITVATQPNQLVSLYRDQPVLLGRPDYLLALLDREPAIEWIQSTWAGVTPLVSHPFRNYRLTGLRAVFGPAMAEYVAGHILAMEMRLRQRLESQRARRWDNRLNGSLRDKTIGIMGTGSIGQEVASRLAAFGPTVIGYNAGGGMVSHFAEIYTAANLAEFLSRCDYLVGLLPDTVATRGLLDSAALAQLPPSSVLINAGRGSLIDEQALCDALNEGRLAAAVLDVCQQEPPPAGSPLWNAPRLLLTGHTAAVSEPAEIATVFLENYRRFCAGEPLRYEIDFEKGY